MVALAARSRTGQDQSGAEGVLRQREDVSSLGSLWNHFGSLLACPGQLRRWNRSDLRPPLHHHSDPLPHLLAVQVPRAGNVDPDNAARSLPGHCRAGGHGRHTLLRHAHQLLAQGRDEQQLLVCGIGAEEQLCSTVIRHRIALETTRKGSSGRPVLLPSGRSQTRKASRPAPSSATFCGMGFLRARPMWRISPSVVEPRCASSSSILHLSRDPLPNSIWGSAEPNCE